MPTSTEQAQYSLAWPVAAALADGRFAVEHVLPPAFAAAAAARLTELVEVEVDPSFDALFPGRRLSAVEVETTDGERYASGPTEAPGEPGDPAQEEIVAAKLRTAGGVRLLPGRLAELLGLAAG